MDTPITELNNPTADSPQRSYEKPKVIYRAPLEAMAGERIRNYDSGSCTLFGKADISCSLTSS